MSITTDKGAIEARLNTTLEELLRSSAADLSRDTVTRTLTRFVEGEGADHGSHTQQEFFYPDDPAHRADVAWFDKKTQQPVAFWEIDGARREKNLIKLTYLYDITRCWLYWGRRPIEGASERAQRTEQAHTLANSLSQWTEEFVRMWRFTRNNGITEGFHRKMKLIQRRAYGFRNFNNYRLRVIAQCG